MKRRSGRFEGKSPAVHGTDNCSESSHNRPRHGCPRLVLEANCTRCGPISEHEQNASVVPDVALRHTASTGHVVILAGTADLPDNF